MAHTRIWESESTGCYYDYNQLNNMILSWEPGYERLSKSDFDKALGIYTMKYFIPSRFGRNAYSGSVGENSISLLKLRSPDNSGNATRFENGRINVFFDYDRKLWENKNQRQLMFLLDNELIAAKIRELGRPVRTRYMWPLSFSLQSKTVDKIFAKHGLTLNKQELEA